MPNAEQLQNLETLADYLEKLPDDYAHFRMKEFAAIYNAEGDVGDSYNRPVEIDRDTINQCGTAACAVGHGPLAGINAKKYDRDWPAYSDRVFGIPWHKDDWVDMFGPDNPDDPHAAAQRIRAYLATQTGEAV